MVAKWPGCFGVVSEGLPQRGGMPPKLDKGAYASYPFPYTGEDRRVIRHSTEIFQRKKIMRSLPLMKRTALAAACCTLLPLSAAVAQDAAVLVERDGEQTVRAGERFEYKVNVKNQANMPVKDVKITEFSGDGKAGGEGKDGKLAAELDYLGAGESKTFTVSGVAREEGTIQSCLAVDYSPATCANIEVVKPDISLACEMDQPQMKIPEQSDIAMFYACEPVEVTCRVTNEGSGKTRKSTLSFNTPDGLVLAEGQAETAIPSIAPGDTKEFTFRLNGKNGNDYSFTPTLQTDQGTAEARAIQFEVVKPSLELALQSPDQEFVNRPVAYSVHLRNTGDVPVPNARLNIQTPDSLENISISSEAAREGSNYDFGTLDPGATRVINVQGDAVEAGTASLSATASGYCVTDMNKTAEVPLKGVPALVLIAYDEVDPVVVGEETRYDIKVKNQGTAPADNIAISGTLGDQLEFVSGTGDSEVSGQGSSLTLAPVSQLMPGETAAWTVTAKAANAGYGRMDLNMESSATKRKVSEQEPTRVIQ